MGRKGLCRFTNRQVGKPATGIIWGPGERVCACVCVSVCVCVLVLNYVNPMFRKALEEVRGDETPSSAAINRNS